MVHAEVPHLARSVVAGQQVILPLRAQQRQRVRLADAAVRHELAFQPDAAVDKAHLQVLVHRAAEPVHAVKEVAVVHPVPLVHGVHVLHAAGKARAPQARELADELARLLRGNVAAQQHAVDEHAQLHVVKERLEIRALAAGARPDGVVHLPQEGEVA